MTCILKTKENLKLLDEYARVLGSQSAAYYVLSQNNGFSLDKTPTGEKSTLFEEILVHNGGDIESAIVEKSMYYTQDYLNTNDWLSKSVIEEPKRTPNIVVNENTSAQKILQNNKVSQIKDELQLSGVVVDDKYAVSVAIDRTRREYLQDQDTKYVQRKRANMRSNNFFKKVLEFFKSAFNKDRNLIEDPESKTRKNAHKRALNEFNETLKWAINNQINELLDKKISEGIPSGSQDFYLSELRSAINDALSKNDDYTADQLRNILSVACSYSSWYTLEDSSLVLDILSNIKKLTDNITDTAKRKLFDEAIEILEKDSDILHIVDKVVNYNPSNPNSDIETVSRAIESVLHALNDELMTVGKYNLFNEIKTTMMMYDNQQVNVVSQNVTAYDRIVEGIQSRLKSLKYGRVTKRSTIASVEAQLSRIKQLDPTNPNDAYTMYNLVLNWASQNLRNVSKSLDEHINGTKPLTADQIRYIKTDYIGFYKAIIDMCISTLTKKGSYLSESQIQALQDRLTQDMMSQKSLYSVLSECEAKYRQVLCSECERIADNFIDQYVGIGDKEMMKLYLKGWLANSIEQGNIHGVEQFVVGGADVSSPVIRTIAKMFNDNDRETKRATEKRAKRLYAAYKKILSLREKAGLSLTNAQKCVLEYDNDGLPTGNFISELNFGQCEKDIKQWKIKYCKKHKLVRNSDGDPQFDFSDPQSEKEWMAYEDALDDFLDTVVDRRYTAVYYKQQRRILGRDAYIAQKQIRDQLNTLKELCRDPKTGFIYINRLSTEQRSQYNMLEQQLSELGNPYIIGTDNAGKKIILSKKTGKDLEIAEHILAWNVWTSQNLRFQDDWDKYNEALAAITDPDERDAFEAANTYTGYDDLFYQQLASMKTVEQDDVYYILQKTVARLMQTTKTGRGIQIPQLQQLALQAQNGNVTFFKQIHDIEVQMEAVRRKGSKPSVDFDEFAVRIPITIADPADPSKRITAFEYFKRLAHQRYISGDMNAMKEFQETFYVTKNVNGQLTLTPLSIFYQTVPRDPKLRVKRLQGDYCSVSGSCVNKNYDSTYGTPRVPKKSIYKNKDYAIFDPNSSKFKQEYRYFLDECMACKREADELQPADDYDNPRSFVQRTGRKWSIFSRNAKIYNPMSWFRAIRLSLQQIFTITDLDDELYREDISLLPDGTPVQSINRRYRKRIDPRTISTDVIGSLIEYYKMAYNYSLKSKSIPVAENMLDYVQSGTKEGYSGSQGERLHKLIQMYGYGKQDEGFGKKSQRISMMDAFLTKLVKGVTNLGQKALLKGKLIVASKGGVASAINIGITAWQGRYFGFKDLGKAFLHLSTHWPSALVQISDPSTTNKVQAAMIYFGLIDPAEAYQGTDKSRIRRMLDDPFMIPFTLTDYTSKAMVLVSVCNAHRLVEIPGTSQFQIMNQEEYTDVCLKHGMSEFEASRLWGKYSGNSVWDMYETRRGKGFTLKNEVTVRRSDGKKVRINPSDYVDTSIINRIAGGSQYRSSVVNGVINSENKPTIYTNPLFRMACALRGFMFTQGADRGKAGNDFLQWFYDQGQYREMGQSNIYSGQYNYESGVSEPAVYRAAQQCVKHFPSFVQDAWFELSLLTHIPLAGKGYQRKLTKGEIASAKQIIGDVVSSIINIALAGILLMIVHNEYPDDWWRMALTVIFLGAGIEMASMGFVLGTVFDLISTVTTIKKWIDDVSGLVGDVARATGIGTEKKLTDYVGANSPYSNKPYWFKMLMERILAPTGVTGVYRTFTPYIEGLDKEGTIPKEKLEAQHRVQDIIKNDPMSIFTSQGLSDFYEGYTSSMGAESTYRFYQGNVFPATLAPSLNSSDKEKEKKKKEEKRDLSGL